MVATRARSGVTSPRPSGCTRFDRNTTNTRSCRIDPDRRPGESGMAERSERQQLAAIGGVGRIDIPSKPADVRLARGRCRRRHPGHGERRENAGRADGAAAEKHPAENREVVGRAEETRVPGDAAHPPRRRIVHDPAQHLHVRSVARPAVRRARLRRGDARHERRRRREHGVPHAERQRRCDRARTRQRAGGPPVRRSRQAGNS